MNIEGEYLNAMLLCKGVKCCCAYLAGDAAFGSGRFAFIFLFVVKLYSREGGLAAVDGGLVTACRKAVGPTVILIEGQEVVRPVNRRVVFA